MGARRLFPRFPLAVPLILLVAGVGLAPAGASSSVKPVVARFSEQAVTGPTCGAPSGLCTVGTFVGGIRGPYEHELLRSIPWDTPNVIVVSTTMIVHTDDGDLFATGSGALSTAPGGRGEFSDLEIISGGTGKWLNASGYLQCVGTFTEAAGGEGVCRGEVVRP